MRKKKTTYQNLNRILNTSSQTFMLVALIGLFALPFVIAKNLEPAVRQAEAVVSLPPRVAELPPVENAQKSDIQAETARPEENVLGVAAVEKPFDVFEVQDQFGLFDKVEPTLTDSSYALHLVKAKKALGRVSLFKLTNSSSTVKTYSLSVVKAKLDSKAQKILTMDLQEFTVGSKTMPTSFTMEPKEEKWFGIKSDDAKGTLDLTINVSLAK
jgi:hypothetical protein